jgi:hypothetical protein
MMLTVECDRDDPRQVFEHFHFLTTFLTKLPDNSAGLPIHIDHIAQRSTPDEKLPSVSFSMLLI